MVEIARQKRYTIGGCTFTVVMDSVDRLWMYLDMSYKSFECCDHLKKDCFTVAVTRGVSKKEAVSMAIDQRENKENSTYIDVYKCTDGFFFDFTACYAKAPHACFLLSPCDTKVVVSMRGTIGKRWSALCMIISVMAQLTDVNCGEQTFFGTTRFSRIDMDCVQRTVALAQKYGSLPHDVDREEINAILFLETIKTKRK